MKLYQKSTGKLIKQNVELADTFFKRLNGLMFKKSIDKDYALIISPCNSIHMLFMSFPIDALFVDKENKIVGFSKNIKPWRISKIYFDAHYVIEMSAGEIERLSLSKGDILYIEK